MAKRKRRQKITTPDLQPQVSSRWRVHVLWGGSITSIIVLVIVGMFWHRQSRPPDVSQVQRTTREVPSTVKPPSETQQQTPLPQTKIKHSERGYLEWETQETDLGDGKKRIEGRVRWNEKSGANGEPVIGMPLIDLEGQVNSETMWGSKVNGWIDEQQTAVYVDYSGPAPAWYDPKADRIVVNPQKSLPRPQLLEELKKGYLHTFILRFHEELHRAQNQRSGKTQANPEMALLREIHAYWISHLPSQHYDQGRNVALERAEGRKAHWRERLLSGMGGSLSVSGRDIQAD